MEDQRYSKQMNWNYDKCHKSNKCCHNNDKHDDKDDKFCKKIEVCWHKEDKCDHKEDKCRCHKEDKCRHDDNKCRCCICDQLKKLEPATVLDLFFAGRVLRVNFLRLDSQNCCAYFLETGGSSPLIIDCNKIDAIRKVV